MIRFEQNNYVVGEEDGELEVCVVVEGLSSNASLPIEVLVEVNNISTGGKNEYYLTMKTHFRYIFYVQVKMISR